MYANIGRKIKGLAIGVFIVEALAAVIVGIILLSNDEIEVGLPILLAGPVVAWVFSWFVYGFGELIDKTCDIARNTSGRIMTSGTQSAVEAQSNAGNERIEKIEKLRSQGLITEEEYQQAISKE